MKISYKWLEQYFEEKLPPAKDVADLLTMNTFEVESVENVGGDHVLDVKVLPNRAHDCLSHRGVAREIAVLLGIDTIEDHAEDANTKFENSALSIEIQNPELCPRYSGAIMQNVAVKPSPQWLKEKLEAIGQKSINNIVDATNYVMFSIGQPMHAFDLDKLQVHNGTYQICVRGAKDGETVDALDGKKYTLPKDTLVITDGSVSESSVLGIAGIKGGKHAEIDSNTTNILLESANFDAVSVRANAKALGLRTDASVRFENGITPELTLEALQMACALISDISAGTVEALVDTYSKKSSQNIIDLEFSLVESVLGVSIPKEKIIKILEAIGCEMEEGKKSLSVTVPFDRIDLALAEDLVEEVGRVFGYLNFVPTEPEISKKEIVNDKNTLYVDMIKDFLAGEGFSEVYTYAFSEKGERELQNPLASDKGFLRTNIADALKESLALNLHNAPLLGLYDYVKIFEIGKVFGKDTESLHLAIALAPHKKVKNADAVNKEMLEDVRDTLAEKLGVKIAGNILYDSVLEIDLGAVLDGLPAYNGSSVSRSTAQDVKYKKVSIYPFVLRDVAVFVPEGVTAEKVLAVISAEAGDMLVSKSLFDVFTKTLEDGSKKTSYAFKLVFQSDEKTLSDDEVGIVMEKVTTVLNSNPDWQVR